MLKSPLMALSESPSLRHFAEQSSIGKQLSGRFAAGTEVDAALEAARRVNVSGASVTIDNLGENSATGEATLASAELYHGLLDAIKERDLQANISVKLTQLGLDLDTNLYQELVGALVRHAVLVDN